MTKKLPPDEQALWDAVVKSIKPIKHDMVVAKIPNVLKIPERPLLPTPGISRTQRLKHFMQMI